MNKIWLKSYPPGVPETVDLTRLRSLKALLEQACAEFADSVAFAQMGTEMTYRELDERSRRFGAWLQRDGFKKGDRIAIMLPNVLQYPVAIFGALRVGLVVVNINPMFTPPELHEQLSDSGATAIVVLEEFAHAVEAVAGRTSLRRVFVTSVGDLLSFPKSWIVNYVARRRRRVPAGRRRIRGAVKFKWAIGPEDRLTLQHVDVGAEDLAFLQYTGGTTGVPKGAMLTHGNLCANLLQSHAWIKGTLVERGVLVTAIPLYHIYALEGNCLLFAMLGWKNVLIVNPRDFPAFVAELKNYPIAFFSGVNTLFKALLNTPGFGELDFSPLKVTLAGGMALEPSIAMRWKEVTGNSITQAWGLTETSPGACINPPGTEYTGSIGLPLPSTDIAIKDDGGHDVAIGELGEICVRGPQVMRGYWNRADETAKVMLFGGWLRTGDIGRMNERGFVYLEDRRKDVIVVSGFKVYPSEVEGVAATYPHILEAVAIASPDARSGEVVVLYVVSANPGTTERELIDHCRKSLAAYKVPKRVYFRSELPKTIVGKVLRKALREELSRT